MSGFYKIFINNYLEDIMLQRKMHIVKETIFCRRCDKKIEEIFHNSEDETLKDFTTYEICNECLKRMRRGK